MSSGTSLGTTGICASKREQPVTTWQGPSNYLSGSRLFGALQAEDEEEETNTLVSQVLDEIGVNLDVDLVNAPGQKHAVAQAAPAAGVAAEPEAMGAAAGGGGGGPGGSSVEDDLQARLDALRKG